MAARTNIFLIRAITAKRFGCVFGFALGVLILCFGKLSLNQGFAIFYWNAVIIRMDFAEGKEAWRLPPYSTKAA